MSCWPLECRFCWKLSGTRSVLTPPSLPSPRSQETVRQVLGAQKPQTKGTQMNSWMGEHEPVAALPSRSVPGHTVESSGRSS